jgi:hypothetical protein
MKHKIELSGIIDINYIDSFEHILLEQEDGYKIDLINRLQEATYNYGSKVSIKY